MYDYMDLGRVHEVCMETCMWRVQVFRIRERTHLPPELACATRLHSVSSARLLATLSKGGTARSKDGQDGVVGATLGVLLLLDEGKYRLS